MITVCVFCSTDTGYSFPDLFVLIIIMMSGDGDNGATQRQSKQNTAPEADYDDDDDDELPTPPDGGWGWVVVLSSFIIHIIADGVAYSFGVFLVEFLYYFPDTGRGELGWIGSLMVGVTLGTGE